MRTLLGDDTYAWPEGPWLRANMVTSIDGAVTGADGVSGSINNAVDREVFHRLRSSADAVLVGAGTARIETYGPAQVPLVVVSCRDELPEGLRGRDGVRLGRGGDAAALRELIAGLHTEGLEHLLVEGGPHLLGDLLRAGLVDELCATFTPRLVAGDMRRMVAGPPADISLRLVGLLEEDSTLLGRWLVAPTNTEKRA